MIAKVFNTYSFTGTVNAEFPDQPDKEFAETVMKKVRESVKLLVVNIFKKGCLLQQIIDSQRLCDANEEKPKGVRLGYMGHLTYISDETCKLFDKCAEDLDDQLHGILLLIRIYLLGGLD
jgi:hypothetical protein